MNNIGLISSFYIKNGRVKIAISLDNKIEINKEKYNVYVCKDGNLKKFKPIKYLDCDYLIGNFLPNLLNKIVGFELDISKTPFKIIKITYNHEQY